MPEPISIKLYGPDDEELKTCTRSVIPWGILKKAIRINQTIGKKAGGDLDEEDVDALAGLVVEIFGDQFTVEDLDKGADVSEMMAVIQAIVARAGALVQADPTAPSATLPRGKKK